MDYPTSSHEKNKVESSTLYLIATPIGNLDDLSFRAVKILSEVSFVAAEDTRVTQKLLRHLSLEKELISYHEHNKTSCGKMILERLKEGQSCAVVTDAGTPAISDPGADLVKLCASEGIRMVSVPGACAAITALSVSGLDTSHFYFEGFLPSKRGDRDKRLEKLSSVPCSIILYEAPHRINATLRSLAERFPDRQVAVCRELTKLNEEILRGTAKELSALADTRELKGEFVLILEGAESAPSDNESAEETESKVLEVYQEMKSVGISKSEAAKQIARSLGISKNTVYAILISQT